MFLSALQKRLEAYGGIMLWKQYGSTLNKLKAIENMTCTRNWKDAFWWYIFSATWTMAS